MVGAGDDDSLDILFDGGLIHVVSHGHIGLLRAKLGGAVVGPGRRIKALGAHERAVDDSIRALKVLPIEVPVRFSEIGDSNAGDRLPVGVSRAAVERYDIVALRELRPHALHDVATRTGNDDSLSCHRMLLQCI